MSGSGPNQARKILFFIPEDWYVCSHRLPLLEAVVAAGDHAVVVTRVARHRAAIEATGARLIPVRLQRGFRNPLEEARGFFELVGIYRRERPDLVHHVTPKSVLFGSLAAWLTRTPGVVNALAGLGFLFASDRWHARLLRPVVATAFRFLLGRANSRVIVQNRDDEAYFRDVLGLASAKIRLIRGAGVDTTRFRPMARPADGRIRVCVVARMLIEKGIVETVAAAAAIRATRSDVDILLAGETDPDSPGGIAVERLEDWNRQGNIQWLGRIDDVGGLLNTCDIALLPSYREGLPKSLLEAAACGLPLIAADVPGCREICLDRVNGLLIPARDSGAIAAAVLKLAEDETLRREMGRASVALVEAEFRVEKVVEQTMDLYREMLS